MLGKLFRQLSEYLLLGKQRAAIAALFCALLPFVGLPLGWFATLIVGLITLQQGLQAGLWVFAWAVLPGVALVVSGNLDALVYVSVTNGLMCCFAWILRSTRSWSLVIEVGMLLGLLVICIAHGMIDNVTGWWEGQLLHYFQDAVGLPKEKVLMLARFATGIEVVFVLLMTLSNLLVVRWWQNLVEVRNGINLRQELYCISVSRVVMWVFLLSLLAVVMRSPTAMDASPVLLLPFVLAGISLFHALVANKKGSLLILLFFYLSLMFYGLYALVVLALVGFTDAWFDFRRWVKQ